METGYGISGGMTNISCMPPTKLSVSDAELCIYSMHSFIKNAKESKERCVLEQRTQRTPRSFIKNAKERKNIAFFCKERMHNPVYT